MGHYSDCDYNVMSHHRIKRRTSYSRQAVCCNRWDHHHHHRWCSPRETQRNRAHLTSSSSYPSTAHILLHSIWVLCCYIKVNMCKFDVGATRAFLFPLPLCKWCDLRLRCWWLLCCSILFSAVQQYKLYTYKLSTFCVGQSERSSAPAMRYMYLFSGRICNKRRSKWFWDKGNYFCENPVWYEGGLKKKKKQF